MAAEPKRAPARLRKEWLSQPNVITGCIETHLRTLNLNEIKKDKLKEALEEAIFQKHLPAFPGVRKKCEIQEGLEKENLAGMFAITLPQVKLAIAKLFRKPEMPVALKRMEKAAVPVTYSRLKSQLRVISMSRSQARATAGPACSVEGHQGLERKCTKLEEENATLRLQLQSLQARNVELGKAGAVYRDVSSLEQDLREHLQNAERKIARLEQFMALAMEERQRFKLALADVFKVQKQSAPFIWWQGLLSKEAKDSLAQWCYGAPLNIWQDFVPTEGKGASGEVKLIDEYWAVKCMNIEENIPKGPNGEVTEVSKNAFERCINEANLTYRHRHANVMPTFIRCYDEKYLYEVMPRMKYGDLLGIFNAGGRMRPEVCAHVMHESLQGVEYLHDKMNQIHRDVKLENILVGSKGTIRIADLGCCGNTGRLHLTCLGTSWYMSPELAANYFHYGSCAYNASVDVWAIGVCTYLLVVGEFPHNARRYLNNKMTSEQQNQLILQETGNNSQAFRARLEGNLRYVAPDCRDFILACMSLNPAARPSVTQLLQHPFIQRRDEAKWTDYRVAAGRKMQAERKRNGGRQL